METNPKEYCKAIKLRSGTSYEGPSMPRALDEEKNGEEEKEEVKEDLVEEEEELDLMKEGEEEKGMGTEEEGEKRVEEKMRVPKWRKAKEVKQGKKEV
ncbi:hypothetical protein ACS0TY_035213 [Phlomoides rotata]